MSTIDKDSDIYKGGSGGLDPENLPDDPNLMLSTGNYRTSGEVEKGWLQVPIAYSDSTRYWFLNIKKQYAESDGKRPPVWFVANNSFQLKTILLDLDLVAFYNNANHQEKKRYLLPDVYKFVNSDSGKYFRLKKVTGINVWDIEFVDLPTPEPELFEIYIDENNAANNRNVNYSNILASINDGKFVYLKVLRSDNTIQYFYYQKLDTSYNRLIFVSLDPSAWFKSYNYYIKNDNTYSSNDYDLLDYVVVIDERVTPPTSSAYFSNMKSEYKAQRSNDIILRYFNSNGDYYKLRAVKMNASETEIMFSIYDPDTARNLSIVVNDQNQYTVIT